MQKTGSPLTDHSSCCIVAKLGLKSIKTESSGRFLFFFTPIDCRSPRLSGSNRKASEALGQDAQASYAALLGSTKDAADICWSSLATQKCKTTLPYGREAPA